MVEGPTKCFFDGMPSQRGDSSGSKGNFWVDCPECGVYEVAERVWRFYFSHPDFLTDPVKRQLSDYVKKNYNPETRKPVLLDKVTVLSLIGEKKKPKA